MTSSTNRLKSIYAIIRTATVLICVITLSQMASCDGFRIGAFNIQTFGQKKANNGEVMKILGKILRRYDIVLIEEIRDASGKAMQQLLKEVNKWNRHDYEMVISDRLGRTKSKEQYAFFYRTDSGIKVLDSYHYDDGDEASKTDTFEREPFIVRFHIPQLAVKNIALVAIHADPDDAVAEVTALSDVVDDVIKRWGTDDVMVMGDFNAACKYFPKKAWKKVPLRTNSKYYWPIGDEIDTTTGIMDCAYDRFVITGRDLIASVIPKTAQAFKFDAQYKLDHQKAVSVSDHYPIELQLELQSSDFTQGDHVTPKDNENDSSSSGCIQTLVSLCTCAALYSCFSRILHLRDDR